ncbi:hypothetical protein SAMN06295905_0130 [Devosia lucknowensis]|uniref:Uncharacterized protein n=1 Tax=Devosia lucknowensis TaxID=1096929 RepID=A0A1Y6E7Z9_9HYPH|nr:hypothetical protein [Devosia lucknowensis]SMQ58765.1 hypothetical protein SAMN06295905_0130 [Devosia lucknowensis]
MGKSEQNQVREQRLAAKLRENLKRRKDQAKARAQGETPAPASVIDQAATDMGTDKKP